MARINMNMHYKHCMALVLTNSAISPELVPAHVAC